MRVNIYKVKQFKTNSTISWIKLITFGLTIGTLIMSMKSKNMKRRTGSMKKRVKRKKMRRKTGSMNQRTKRMKRKKWRKKRRAQCLMTKMRRIALVGFSGVAETRK